MSINDLIFAVGSLIFFFALLPTVFKDEKPALETSLITGIVLSVFVGNYLAIEYYYAAVVTSLTAFAWFVIALQTIGQDG
jgi:hypothetical protein